MKEIAQKAKRGRKAVIDLLQLAKEQRDLLLLAVKKNIAKSSFSLALAAFGLVTISLAGVVFVFLLILLVDLFFQKPWLSTLAVMLGMIITGGASSVVGFSRLKQTTAIATRGFKNYLSQEPQGRMLSEQAGEVKETVMEIVETLQKKKDEQKRRVEELWSKAKENAPVILLSLVVIKTLKKRKGNKKEK